MNSQDTTNILYQLGCGSALPALYLLARDEKNMVDVQDYNEQVIRFITIPNILLNTVLSVQNPADMSAHQADEAKQDDRSDDEVESGEDDEDDEDEENEEKDQIIGDSSTCDAEAEIPEDKIEVMLKLVSEVSSIYG